MRSKLAALVLLALSACSSSGTDVTGLWATQIGSTTVCRVFCADGLTLDSFGEDSRCDVWHRFDGLLSCFPYDTDGDQLSIGDDALGTVVLSGDRSQLTWSEDGSSFVYTRLGDTAPVCSQPCFRAGNENEPLRR